MQVLIQVQVLTFKEAKSLPEAEKFKEVIASASDLMGNGTKEEQLVFIHTGNTLTFKITKPE